MQHDIVERVETVAWPWGPGKASVAASECDWTGGPSWNDPGRMDGGRLRGA